MQALLDNRDLVLKAFWLLIKLTAVSGVAALVLGSLLIALTKNATIAGTIGVAETATLMKDLINDNGDQTIGIFAGFALGFLVITLPMGYLFGWLSRREAVLR